MSEVRVQRDSAVVKPETTSEERTWATIAHLSTIVTVMFGLPTGGLGGLLLVFVPFVIYVIYKDKSRYVADQAAQAFALQIVATVGAFVAILIGLILFLVIWGITLALTLVVVGLLLWPVAFLLTLVIILICLALLLVPGVLSVVAAVETGNGRDYHYPYIGPWVADRLARHEAEPTPAV